MFEHKFGEKGWKGQCGRTIDVRGMNGYFMCKREKGHNGSCEIDISWLSKNGIIDLTHLKKTCQCGTKNDIDAESCNNCQRNIKGVPKLVVE